MPNLAIVGYGKMGRIVEQLAPEYGFSVALKRDPLIWAAPLAAEDFRGVDVAVDFTVAEAVRQNVEAIASVGVNLVIGTTGWLEHMEGVRRAVERHGTGVVWSPNF